MVIGEMSVLLSTARHRVKNDCFSQRSGITNDCNYLHISTHISVQ